MLLKSGLLKQLVEALRVARLSAGERRNRESGSGAYSWCLLLAMNNVADLGGVTRLLFRRLHRIPRVENGDTIRITVSVDYLAAIEYCVPVFFLDGFTKPT